MARALVLVLLLFVGCTSTANAPVVKTCDAACKDQIALRSLRDGLKHAFNVTFQGMPVGMYDITIDPKLLPLGGTARVFGTATSNPDQGATNVHITYVFDHVGIAQKDDNVEQTYHMTLSGTVTEDGVIAVQPSSTTALGIKGASVTFSGTVYDPPLDYEEMACAITIQQDGNRLNGTMCGRDVGLTL